MPRPKVDLAAKSLTASQVCEKLKLSLFQLNLRIDRQLLPPPTFVDNNGVRYFSPTWLQSAKEILWENEGAAGTTSTAPSS
jgi:hypothetical protein